MSPKCWRRLAGCIAISCGLEAGTPDYRAGTAEAGRVKAVVLADRQGRAAVIADARFSLSLAGADFISAELMKRYPLDRPAILLHSAEPGPSAPADAIRAIEAALADLRAARVSFDGSVISVASDDGSCRAVLFPLAFAGCTGGEAVHSPIRAAFRVVEPEHGLERRGDRPPLFPIQAIAFGKRAGIVAVGVDAPPARFRVSGWIVVTNANGIGSYSEEQVVAAAIRQLLAGMKR